jgi:c-di-AMP phosphodiesterase-like protein
MKSVKYYKKKKKSMLVCELILFALFILIVFTEEGVSYLAILALICAFVIRLESMMLTHKKDTIEYINEQNNRLEKKVLEESKIWLKNKGL